MGGERTRSPVYAAPSRTIKNKGGSHEMTLRSLSNKPFFGCVGLGLGLWLGLGLGLGLGILLDPGGWLSVPIAKWIPLESRKNACLRYSGSKR